MGAAKKRIEEFRSELRSQLEDRPRYRATLSFIAKMLLAGVFFRIILFLNPDTEFFQIWLTEIVQLSLNMLGYSFEQQGYLLIGDGADYLITRDCLGWKSIAAFIALVFASADKVRSELKVLLLGVISLSVANLLRIVSTVILSEVGIISFDIIHTFLWRWGMTLLVLAAWYLWLNGGLPREIRGIFK